MTVWTERPIFWAFRHMPQEDIIVFFFMGMNWVSIGIE
jgi:hypothetical protein